MNQSRISNFLGFHLAMFMMSTSGVLGRYIDLPPTSAIFYRVLLASCCFYVICLIGKKKFAIANKKDRLTIISSGILLALHFVFYFHALQLSNVAIGMLSLFTYPVFTAFLEPLITKSRFQKIHLLLALFTLIGVYFLVPMSNDTALQLNKAVLLGLLSACLYSIRNVLMKQQVKKYDSKVLMFIQMAAGSIVLIPAVFFTSHSPSFVSQLPYIFILVIVTTVLGHTIFLRSFRNFSVTTASLMSAVIPIYGIVLGYLFLKEIPSYRTVFGGLCILLAVIVESYRSQQK